MTMDRSMISSDEANDLIQAIVVQRDTHANNEAQLNAALSAARRKIAALEQELAKAREAAKSHSAESHIRSSGECCIRSSGTDAV